MSSSRTPASPVFDEDCTQGSDFHPLGPRATWFASCFKSVSEWLLGCRVTLSPTFVSSKPLLRQIRHYRDRCKQYRDSQAQDPPSSRSRRARVP